MMLEYEIVKSSPNSENDRAASGQGVTRRLSPNRWLTDQPPPTFHYDRDTF